MDDLPIWGMVGELTASDKEANKLREEVAQLKINLKRSKEASDKEAILFRILDPASSNMIRTFAYFKQWEKAGLIKTSWFAEFDAHVCSLLGTPMLRAGLQAKSAAVCMRAIGLGAEATAADLEKMAQDLRVDLKEEVETRFGKCNLAIVFARAGRAEALRYVLDAGVDFGLTSRILADNRGLGVGGGEVQGLGSLVGELFSICICRGAVPR